MLRPTAHVQAMHMAHNTHTWGGVRLHRVTWDSYVRIPPLLLEKWSTTGSLSQNLFCLLQAKGEWLIILESLKKKDKQRCFYKLKQPNKQGCSYKLKRLYICGVHLGLWPQTSPNGLCLLSFPSLSLPVLVRLLSRDDLGLYLYLYFFYCACMFNSLEICAQVCMMCLHDQFPRDMCTSSVYFDPWGSLGWMIHWEW